MNKAGKLYIQHVGLLLDCTLGRKRDAMADVRHIVELYLEDNPNASYEDITKELGDPEHMTDESLMDIPVAERIPGRRIQKKLYLAVIGVMLIVTIAAVGQMVYFIQNPYYLGYFTSLPADPRAEYYKSSQKYKLIYELNDDGYIMRATDRTGQEVDVNEKGIPISEYEQ